MADIPDGTSSTDPWGPLFSEFLDAMFAAIDGRDCVLSGGNCTQQGTPDMTVAVGKGSGLSNGALIKWAATNATISAAHATLKRIDLIVATAGGIAVRTGTAAALPKPPARTANDVTIRAVRVDAAVTTIVTADLATDLRFTRTQGPIVIDKVITPVVFNTTSAIQTYYSLVLPSGLLLAGKSLHVRLGGTALLNSGTPTWTLTVAYGGTTLFADPTATIAAAANRRGWFLEFDLVAQGNADQQLHGKWWMNTSATVNGPTTGISGDLAALSGLTSPVGSAAVDSDAADRTLTVQVTMNISHANNETVMEFAEAVLS